MPNCFHFFVLIRQKLNLFFILGIFPTKPSVTLRSFRMSMTYFLVPDKKSSCSDDSLIAKIKRSPEYYKKVIHDPDYQKHLEESIRIGRSGDTTQYSKWLKEAEKSNYYYPPDHGYLRERRILKDLNDLKKTIDCYQKNGVTKVRLEYM
jgi:hypothetical protein